MDWHFLILPVSALILGGVGIAYAWQQSRAFDRKWGHHQPGE
ncbi:MAG: hypothetical protein ACRYGP_16810 [Janthinobacterium lividum]